MQSLKRIDPRVFAIEHPIWTSLIALILLVSSIPAGIDVFDLRGGILDDSLPSYDVYHEMDERIAREPNFNSADAAQIVVWGSEEDLEKRLQTVYEMSRELKDRGYTVASLATVRDYRDTGEELLYPPYLTPETFISFDAGNFRKHVFSKSAVANVLIGPTWAGIGVVFPKNYNEVQEAWRLVEYLEGHKLSKWERFFKKDITPSRNGVMPIGWIFIRWLIDQCLNRDMIILVLCGVIIATVVSYVVLHSLRQALLIALLGVGTSIWLTRASIAPVHAVFPGFNEFVYTILAYANIVVQGTSLPLHKLKAYRAAVGGLSERFRGAFSVDGEMVLVALIAIGAFSFLNNAFPLWQLQAMGYQSIVGVVVVFLVATIVIPAVYILLDKVFGAEQEKSITPVRFPRIERSLEYCSACFPSWAGIAVPLGAFGCAVALAFAGKIAAYTMPLDYIKGTGVWKVIQFLKGEGAGTDMLPAFVQFSGGPRPDGYRLARDIALLTNAWGFEKSFRDGRFETWQKQQEWEPVSVQAVNSVLDGIAEVSGESYKHEFPETADEVEDILRYTLPNGFSKELREWLWNSNGFRLCLFTNADDSVALRKLTERMLQYAATNYPLLSVDTIGKVPVFPQADYYIRIGVWPNIGYTLATLIAFYAGWLWWERRKLIRSVNTIYTIRPFLGACVLTLPFPLGLGVMGMIMAWLGIGLSMATVPITDLAVNAGNDFSVYIAAAYLNALHRGKNPKEAALFAVVSAGIVVILDCALNMSGFAPLGFFSQFEPIRELGWMMVVMLAFCCLGAIFCVPAALQLVTIQLKTKKEVSYEETVEASGSDDRNAPSLAAVAGVS